MKARIMYIEALSGVSGDMLLGALLDLGVPVEVMHAVWDQLGLDHYEVEVFETRKCGMKALRCRVRTQEKLGPRTWREYRARIVGSKLGVSLRSSVLDLCKKLLEIEALIHGSTLQKVHLHEAGGIDLLIDVSGTLAAIEFLGPLQITASPVNTGKGFVRFSHGTHPVPPPAVSILLEGKPVFQNEVEGELTTPTGALLLSHLAGAFGPMPEMTFRKAGVGAGEREIEGRPNVLRIFLGDSAGGEEEVYLVETNLDDSNPQILAYFMETALEKGALDVFFTPVVMKKNRPGVRLSMLTQRLLMDELIRILFAETTAIGLRYWKVDRRKLDRRWKEVRVGKLPVRIKESYLDGRLYNYQPEYEDCRTAARTLDLPVKEILARAIHAYLGRSG